MNNLLKSPKEINMESWKGKCSIGSDVRESLPRQLFGLMTNFQPSTGVHVDFHCKHHSFPWSSWVW